jgi:hypothetical protein
MQEGQGGRGEKICSQGKDVKISINFALILNKQRD